MSHSTPGLPCPSRTLRVHPNSCPSSQWCHPAISSSVIPFSFCPPIPPSIRVFSNESIRCMSWPKYWSFSLSISPSNEYPALISFRMDWLDLLAVQGIVKSLLQHQSSETSIIRCSAFFTVQLSHPYMTSEKTIALTRWTFVREIKNPMRYHLVPIRMTFTKWQELRMWRKQNPFTHCWYVYKLVLQLWGKKCMVFPKTNKQTNKNYKLSYNMIKQYYYWVYIQRNKNQYLKQITAHPSLLQHHSQYPRYKNSLSVQKWLK